MADEQPPNRKRTRGDVKLGWLSKLKRGEKIKYEHLRGVPVRENSNKIVAFVGKLAKDGTNFPFDQLFWDDIPDLDKRIEKALNEVKEISERNTKNKKLQKIVHIAGSKSYMNHAADIEKETEKPASRVDIFKRTHRRTDTEVGDLMNQMEDLQKKAVEDGLSQDDLNSELDGDIYSQVMPTEKPGRYRGVGIGVKWKKVRKGSKGYSSQDNEDVQMMREQISILHQQNEDLRKERDEMRKYQDDMQKKQDQMQKNQDKMQKNMKLLLSYVAQNDSDQDGLPTFSNSF